MANLNLSGASNADINNYLIQTDIWTLAYSAAHGCPLWCSWEVTKAHIGSTPRKNNFHADAHLPAGCYAVKPSDYDHMAYDRGHNCDCADWTDNPADETITFDMANMTPQFPELNRQTWEHLEAYTRKQVEAGFAARVWCGVCGDWLGAFPHVPVSIPARMWKVVAFSSVQPVQNRDGSVSLASFAAQVEAVIMPNSHDIDHDWSKYKVSVADVQSLAGYDFGLGG